jgi:hypothetical protein
MLECQGQAGDKISVDQKMIDAGLAVFDEKSGGFDSMAMDEIGRVFPIALEAALACIGEAPEKKPKHRD